MVFKENHYLFYKQSTLVIIFKNVINRKSISEKETKSF